MLGKVTKGIDNVKAMEDLASTEDGPPKEPIVIKGPIGKLGREIDRRNPI